MRVYSDAVVGVAVALGFATAAFGCGDSADDRAGGKPSQETVTLTMANPLPSPDELRPFVDEVERLSAGKLKIRFRNKWLGWPWTRPEAALIRDVASGRADLGWVATRAWDDVGVTSFDALHAPLLIDSYALQAAVLETEIDDEMLKGVEPLGLIGIAVLPGPLRKVLGVARPLVRPADFRGLRIGLNGSRIGAESLHALGATPVTVPGGVNLEGRLDGLEQQVASIEGNTYDEAAKYLTANVNLWPRQPVVFMNAEAYRKLDDVQQDALHKAAQMAIPTMLAAAEAEQETATLTLCGRGLKLAVASAADIRQLRQAVAPVVARLERDPEIRSFLTTVQGLREKTRVPTDSIGPCPVRNPPKDSGVLDGTYVSITTAADAHRARIPPNDPIYKLLPIRFRLVMKEGVYRIYDRDRHGTRDVGAGTYTVYRDRIVFVDPPDRLPFAWSFDGKTLTFDDGGTGGYFGAQWAQSWTRVG
jgi:TRAP-type C4-dicarboxylate transport system substrate-binding protein